MDCIQITVKITTFTVSIEGVSKGILSSKNSSVTSCHLLYEQDFLDSPISIYCAKAIPNLTIKNYKS